MMKSRSVIATPPGATIKEQLLDRGLSQKEFALRMDMSEKHISKLINGEVQLTPDVAYRLEMVLGVPAKFWNNLEATYREKLVKVKVENAMEADKELAKQFPYSELAKLGWVPKTKKLTEKVINLRKFFEVVNLEVIQNTQISKIACRRLSITEKGDLALLVWAQKAKIEARKIDTSSIDLKTLKKIISQIRCMTIMDPEYFCPELINLLADCGIALVFLPHISGSFWHGATFYDGKKIVIGLTVRGKDADKFWFSLFHELGHVLLGHINQVDGTTEEDEEAADNFAKETLISSTEFHRFTSQKDFSKTTICSFAQEQNILCGIVVGRLQKEGFINYNCYNDLKKKYALEA